MIALHALLIVGAVAWIGGVVLGLFGLWPLGLYVLAAGGVLLVAFLVGLVLCQDAEWLA